METHFKGTDKEGRIRLGHKYANKQWQLSELDGAIILVPMVPATDGKVSSVFKKMLNKHRKTIDSLQ